MQEGLSRPNHRAQKRCHGYKEGNWSAAGQLERGPVPQRGQCQQGWQTGSEMSPCRHPLGNPLPLSGRPDTGFQPRGHAQVAEATPGVSADWGQICAGDATWPGAVVASRCEGSCQSQQESGPSVL